MKGVKLALWRDHLFRMERQGPNGKGKGGLEEEEEGNEMKGEEDEMKQRREVKGNMCHAQLLCWCLLAMLEALGLNCGHHSPDGSGEACRGGRQRFCVGEEDTEQSELIGV